MNRNVPLSTDRAALARAAALLLGLAVASCGNDAPPAATAGSRTIVLISLDTLRPQRLGVYGNSADVSPNIDAFAREAVVFDDVLSVAPWTLPAHMSMLTGLDPIAHGVRWSANRLSTKVETVAETLSAAGYETAAFADGGFAGTGWGLEDGFALFDSRHRDAQGRTGFARYLEQACQWLRASGDKPVFLFLHSFDIHAPYDECAPEVLSRFRARATPDGELDHELYKGSHTAIAREMRMAGYQRISEVLNDYDAGVHEADLAVGQVFRALREAGRWDDALVIVTSDHGESFYDQRLWVGHGINLTDDEIAVPLLVKFPGNEGAGARVATLVDTVDLAPTMLDAAGARVPSVMKGSSLRELVRGAGRSRGYVFGHTANAERYFLVRGDLKYISGTALNPFQVIRPHLDPVHPAVFGDQLAGSPFKRKLAGGGERVTIYSEAADPLGYIDTVPVTARLYDRRADPRERRDLSHERPEELRKLAEALLRVEQESARVAASLADNAAPRTMTPSEQKGLAELGYLNSDGDAGGFELSQAAEPSEGPPDMTPLWEVDPIVHRARIAVRAGQSLDAAQVGELAQCAVRIADWGEANVTCHFRAQWRLKEIEQISAAGGAALELSGELRRVAIAVARSRTGQRATTDPTLKEELKAEREARRRERRSRSGKSDADAPPDDDGGR